MAQELLEDKNTVLVYGNARWGRPSVWFPFLRYLQSHPLAYRADGVCRVIPVNEYRTSMTCNRCLSMDAQVHPRCWNPRELKYEQPYRLKYCQVRPTHLPLRLAPIGPALTLACLSFYFGLLPTFLFFSVRRVKTCGILNHRDKNAAQNILLLGLCLSRGSNRPPALNREDQAAAKKATSSGEMCVEQTTRQ